MSKQLGYRLVRGIAELVLAPVVALLAMRLAALVCSWCGFESVSAAFVTMLYAAPATTLLTFILAFQVAVVTLVGLHGWSPPQPWSLVVARAVLPIVVVLGVVRALPASALIVAGMLGAVLAGQALALTRLGTPRPPRGSGHAG